MFNAPIKMETFWSRLALHEAYFNFRKIEKNIDKLNSIAELHRREK